MLLMLSTVWALNAAVLASLLFNALLLVAISRPPPVRRRVCYTDEISEARSPDDGPYAHCWAI
ncbi:hypothetical protein H4R18_003600 [Coemansia javaensis]|uniref:Uncharacterized protein n=1 Tax=Coemansia javaensis TaxID=2761396 RepID=A0A9W8HET1_9FUNG|nr:hypothetical protein H4R18_003600 [Coemansia javaensis]